MNELALFAGSGGGILGGHLLGWRTVCAVEWDAYAASVLVHRQNDGSLPPFPIWDDVQTFGGRSWRGRVDVISGGFPAKTLAPPEKEQESTESDPVCGDTWQELLVKYDPASSSWKTAHCLWDEDLPESSVTLPRWGMTVGGQCWEREMPEHLTSGTGSGLLPTPTCADSWNPSTMKSAEREWTQGNLRGIAAAPVKVWPTPTKDDAVGNLSNCKPNQFSMLRRCKDRLEQMWPTPTANEDAAGTPNGKMQSMLGNHPDIRGTTQEEWDGGQLNPDWVEWLMGWPIGWTDLNALATDKCPSAQP